MFSINIHRLTDVQRPCFILAALNLVYASLGMDTFCIFHQRQFSSNSVVNVHCIRETNQLLRNLD